MLTFNTQIEDNGERIDKVVVKYLPDLTRSAVQRLLEQQCVLVGDKNVSKNFKLTAPTTIMVDIKAPVSCDIVAENIPLDIVYEDNDLLVVNKPKDMVVHPAVGNYSGTLVNALMYHCGDSLSGINGVIRPGIVHRIDKNTSGLLIVAKNDYAHQHLAEQIKEHSFSRQYQAVVYGKMKETKGMVEAPIGRHPVDRKKMAVTTKNSREAITHYELINQYENFAHLKLVLETGRTHQIRVHMAHIGHPVAGDDIYGPKKIIKQLNGQCLHAKLIGFIHPRTGQYLEFESELPDYFTKFLKTLK